MALTINPAVSGTQAKWVAHSMAFALGAFLGGLGALLCVLLLAAALGIVLSTTWIKFVFLVPIGVALARDLGLPVRLPYRNQQVPEWFRNVLPQGVVAFMYGAMLGLGFLTLFTYSSHVAMLAALPFLDSFLSMIAVVLLFAAGKTLVLGATLGVETPEQVSPRFLVDPASLRLLRLATTATSFAVAVSIMIRA